MATQPQPETPPPSQPTQPDMPPAEFPTPGNDTDIPSPGTMAADPGGSGFAASSAVGSREAGDSGDIGGTDGMQASTGGLAGTSR